MTTVIISYNDVNGFSSGWHGNQQLFVCANDAGPAVNTGDGNTTEQRLKSVTHKIADAYYKGTIPIENVGCFYVYAGMHAFQSAIGIARILQRKCPLSDIALVSCKCDRRKKEILLWDTRIRWIPCECGGNETLGEIASKAVLAIPSSE